MTKKTLHLLTNIVASMVFLFLLPGCKKITETLLPSPQISIVSAKPTALTDYEVTVKVDLGDGQPVKSAEVTFTDITVLTDSAFIVPVSLTGEKQQTVTVRLRTSRLNHDYSVKATIHTDKYVYSSELAIIRSDKNIFRAYMLEDDYYSIPELGVAECGNRGSRIVLFIDYQNQFTPDSLSLRLNRTIPLPGTFDWNAIGGTALAVGTLPADIEPGIYEIYIYIDGVEIRCENKVKILGGTWSLIDATYQGPKNVDQSWFLLGDDLYLVGGHYPVSTVSVFPVWKFNLQTGQWQNKINFPATGNISYDEIFPFNLQYNNEGYVLHRHDTMVKLWKYQPGTDSWIMVTTYPGAGKTRLNCFVIQHQLFAGGGGSISMGDHVYDFWSYDFITGIWTRLNDTPVGYAVCSNSACVDGTNAYLFEYSRKLWKYEPEGDLWTEKARFIQPRRSNSTLVYFGGKLYLTGGTYYTYPYFELNDCWEYSISDDTWQLNSFLPDRLNYGLSFAWDGKIVAGMGFDVEGFNDIKQQVLYQFIP